MLEDNPNGINECDDCPDGMGPGSDNICIICIRQIEESKDSKKILKSINYYVCPTEESALIFIDT